MKCRIRNFDGRFQNTAPYLFKMLTMKYDEKQVHKDYYEWDCNLQTQVPNTVGVLTAIAAKMVGNLFLLLSH